MKPYTYNLIEFFTVVVCFIYSFNRKIRFYKHFPSFLKASALVAVPFIAWDIWFTKERVWWFGFDYTLGIKLAGLPIEEWLFFICIPFSCVFTFFVIDRYFSFEKWTKYNSPIAWATILTCLAVIIFFYDRAYPALTAFSAMLTMIFLHFIAKVDWIAKASLVFAFLMIGFFPVNGILTGSGLDSPIVNYNPGEILNIRMFTIPIEDAVYGYTQFMLIWYFFLYFESRSGNVLYVVD